MGKGIGYEKYGEIKLGDRTLSLRVQKALEQLSAKPEASISGACGDAHQAKAIYRLLGNEKFTATALMSLSLEETLARITNSGKSILLSVQDTTEVNYSSLQETEGLGTIGYRKNSRGLELHSALGVSTEGEVYGLLAQRMWVRPAEQYGKKHKRQSLPIEQKESIKWLDMVDALAGKLPEHVELVHVCDRESDIYEFFCKVEDAGQKYLCRQARDRKTNDAGSLFQYIESMPAAGSITVSIPRDSHTKRKERNADLQISYGKISICKPGGTLGSKCLPDRIEAYAVYARETAAPEGVEGLTWHLITNVETKTFEEAVQRLEWYALRWKIETFHHVLKSGCNIEKLQESTADRLFKLISLYSVIAVRIMIMTIAARVSPNASCENLFACDEWRILYRVANRTKATPERPPSIVEAVILIARLGGFLARKSDGLPGLTVVWRGMSAFSAILAAAPFLS